MIYTKNTAKRISCRIFSRASAFGLLLSPWWRFTPRRAQMRLSSRGSRNTITSTSTVTMILVDNRLAFSMAFLPVVDRYRYEHHYNTENAKLTGARSEAAKRGADKLLGVDGDGGSGP